MIWGFMPAQEKEIRLPLVCGQQRSRPAQTSNILELVETSKLQINREISHELIKIENLMFRITMSSKFLFSFLKK